MSGVKMLIKIKHKSVLVHAGEITFHQINFQVSDLFRLAFTMCEFSKRVHFAENMRQIITINFASSFIGGW